jgi:AcrR family transcriptional regulator
MKPETKKATKGERTRAAILAAAQALFAERGYERTSVRDIAAAASIDPAMVIRYFGSKDELFARAALIDLKLPDFPAAPPGELGASMVRHFLDIWEGGAGNGGMVVLLRSAASNEFAADRMREVFAAQVMPAVARAGQPRDAATRAGLVSSQLLGLALGRYILRLPPVVAMSPEQIVAWVGPTLQRYLSGAGP